MYMYTTCTYVHVLGAAHTVLCARKCTTLTPDSKKQNARGFIHPKTHYLSRLCASILLFWLEEQTTATLRLKLISAVTAHVH